MNTVAHTDSSGNSTFADRVPDQRRMPLNWLHRALRMALALLNRDDHAKEVVEQEIGDCPDCLRADAGYLAGAYGGVLLGQGKGQSPCHTRR
jgi:hypothetical protein